MKRKGTFETGHIPSNKIILSPEQETFLLENYGKMTKVALAKEFGVKPCTILDMMNRRGLKRTPEQLKLLAANKSKVIEAIVEEEVEEKPVTIPIVLKPIILSKKANALEKQKIAELQAEKFSKIKEASPKNTEEAIDQLVKEDKVAIKLDARTTVWVNRSKCKFVNGEWIRKKPLSIKISEENEIETPEITEQTIDLRIKAQLKKGNILKTAE